MALAGWYYSKDVNLNGEQGAEANWQTPLKVGESSGSSGCDFHLDGHSAKFPSGKNDGGDLRFTDLDDNLLSFWVQKVEGTTPNRVAYVWVKVSADLSSDQTIRCYYGNSNASNASDGSTTFELFNDFKSADYSMIRGNSSQVSIVNNDWLRIDATSGYDSSSGDIIAELNNSMSLSGNYSIEGRVYLEKPDEWIGWIVEDGSGKGYACGWYGWAGTKGSIERWGGWNSHSLLEQEISHHVASQGSYQNLRWDKVGSELRFWDTDGSGVIKTHSDSTYSSFSKVAIRALKNTIWQIDWIFVRKYADPEPSFKSAGAEVFHGSKLSGTVCDKNGNPITGVVVDIAFLKKDTKELLHTCQSNSNDGTWVDDQIPADPNAKVLAVFSLEGDYNGDTDIAGAEFTTTEQT